MKTLQICQVGMRLQIVYKVNRGHFKMSIESLPYRYRYAKEIAGYQPSIIDRIMTRLRKIGKPWDGTQSHTVNWYYDPTSPDDFVCCGHPLPPLPSNKPQP